MAVVEAAFFCGKSLKFLSGKEESRHQVTEINLPIKAEVILQGMYREFILL